MRGVAPFPLVLRPSRIRRWVTGAAHALALAAAILATVPLWVTAALVVAILCSATIGIRQDGCLQLFLHGDGSLEVMRGDGERDAVELLAESRRLPGMLLMAWRNHGKIHRCVIWPDSASAEEQRHLRSWLGALVDPA